VKPSGAPSSTPTVALLIEAKIQLVQEFSTSLTAVALTDNLPAQTVFVKQMALSFGVHHTKVSITRIYDGSARRTQEKTKLRRLQASTGVLVDYDVRVAVDADEEEVVRLQFEAVTTQMAKGSFITEMDTAMNAVLGAGAVISQTPDIPAFDYSTMEVAIVRSPQPSAAPTEEPEVFSFDSDILYSIVGSLAGLGLLAFGAIYIKHNMKAGKVDIVPPVEIEGQANTEPVLTATVPMQTSTPTNVAPKEKLAFQDEKNKQELADFLEESDSSGSEDDEIMQARVQARVDAAAARQMNNAEEIRVADPTEGPPMDGPGEANEVVDAKTAALDKYLLDSNSESSEDEKEEEGKEDPAAAAAAAEPLSAEAKKALLLERIAALDAEISSDSESEIDSEEGEEADAAAAAAKKKQTEEEAAQRAMQMRLAILDSELSSDSDDSDEDEDDKSDTSDTSDEDDDRAQADANAEATEAEKVAAHEKAVADAWGDLSSDSDDSD
jgi:hypothetical protein